jgi:D-alanyl-D-alanine carboxypeptidase/D-alanyl-D-alanine-endopeptidase (penicillin-binding protein 4)
VPASNAKLFTTIAAYELLPGSTGRTGRRNAGAAGGGRKGVPDVMLEGRGDPRLSSAPDCRSNCLSTLADAVASGPGGSAR